MSNSLGTHGLQHTRLPCPSPSPRVCSNSCPSVKLMSLLKLMSQFRGRGGSPRGLWAVLKPDSWGRQMEILSFIFLGLLRFFSYSQSLWCLLRESNESLLLHYMWSNPLPPLPARSHCPSATLAIPFSALPPWPLPVSPPHPMLSSPLHGPIHKLQKHRWVDLSGILIPERGVLFYF